MSAYSSTFSISSQSRSCFAAATASVPAPPNGSRSNSPGFDASSTARSSRASGFCDGCLPCARSRFARDGELPEVAHLLAAVHLLRVPVVERPAGRLRRRLVHGPDDLLGALGQRAGGDVRLRVRLEPDDGVEDAPLQHVLEDEAELVDVVVRAEDEDVAVRLHDARDFAQPLDVEREELVLRERVPLSRPSSRATRTPSRARSCSCGRCRSRC